MVKGKHTVRAERTRADAFVNNLMKVTAESAEWRRRALAAEKITTEVGVLRQRVRELEDDVKRETSATVRSLEQQLHDQHQNQQSFGARALALFDLYVKQGGSWTPDQYVECRHVFGRAAFANWIAKNHSRSARRDLLNESDHTLKAQMRGKGDIDSFLRESGLDMNVALRAGRPS